MPRGIYDRSKTKTKTAAPVAAKATPAKKTATVHHKTAKADKMSPEVSFGEVRARASVVDAQAGFQILGANLSTLVEAFKTLNNIPVSLKEIPIGKEIQETVKAMASLRESIFGVSEGTTTSVVEETAPQETAEDKVDVKTVAPTAPVTSLPQPTMTAPPTLHGNAAPFQPPAPPTLPSH